MSSPYAIYHRTAVVIAVTCTVTSLLLFASANDSPQHLWRDGIIVGTVYLSTMLAAAWTAFGPARLSIRLPLSLAWAGLMGLSIDLPLLLDDGPRQFGYFLLMTSILWLAAQLPFWSVASYFQLRLRHQGSPPASDQRSGQFGIRQLLLFTTFIAVLLGIGRGLLLSVPKLSFDTEELQFWGFLFVAQIAISVPLICATMLPRRVCAGICVSLVLIAGVTAVQWPLARQIVGGTPTDEFTLSVSANLTSIFWAFVFALVIRYSGYHFGVPQIMETPPPNPQPAERVIPIQQ